jgi:hypothetical protein
MSAKANRYEAILSIFSSTYAYRYVICRRVGSLASKYRARARLSCGSGQVTSKTTSTDISGYSTTFLRWSLAQRASPADVLVESVAQHLTQVLSRQRETPVIWCSAPSK